MGHKFLVLTVKKWLKSVYIYGSYRKIKTGVSLFWTTLFSVWDCRRKILELKDKGPVFPVFQSPVKSTLISD